MPMILYSHNKTSLWLDKKTEEEKKTLLQAACTLAPVISRKFKERGRELEAKRGEALVQKQHNIARKDAKLVHEKELLTKEIEKFGLWTCRDDVESELVSLKKKADNLRVLKLQINFRRKVLGQSDSDSSVFRFSQNRKQHSVKQNLFQLLVGPSNESDGLTLTSHARHEEVLTQPELLVGLRITHQFEVDGELSWLRELS